MERLKVGAAYGEQGQKHEIGLTVDTVVKGFGEPRWAVPGDLL